MKIQSKTKLNHKGEQSEVGYINLLQDGYLTIDNLERGDYVLTMYVQCDSIGNISIGEQSQDITTSWNKVSYILSNVENIINIKFKKGVYYIYEVKLEKGNKATDWTPAPEDISVENIYTPNTTTIDGGKITTGSIKAAQIAAGTITANEIAVGTITANKISTGTITADKINLNDLFAQNITASGTITGATLKGANVEATSGSIGNWSIKNGSIVNEVTENHITKRTEFKANTNLRFETINGRDNPSTTITGDNIISGNSVSKTTISPNEIKTVFTAASRQPYSSITPETIYENGTAISEKYLGITAKAESAKTADSVAWTNISDRPTALSAFTNDRGYITNSTSVLYIGSTSTNGYIDYYYNKNRTRLTANTALSSETTLRLPANGGTLALASSDIRLKDNIDDSVVNAIDLIKKIKMRQFDWNDNSQNGYLMSTHQDIGFIADELEELDERLSIGGGMDADGEMNIKTVDTFYLLGYVVKALQEIISELDM